MGRYWPRVIDLVLDQRMASAAAVLIEGPKACGRTDTASMVRLDVDEDARQAAQIDPGLLPEGARPRSASAVSRLGGSMGDRPPVEMDRRRQ